MRWTTQARSAPSLTYAASASRSSASPGPTTRRVLVGRRRRILLGTPASPPDRGVQVLPQPAPLTPVVDPLPLAGQDSSATDFIHVKPVLPDIKVSTLKSSMFCLPDAKIFMDKSLPDPEPSFMERIIPNPSFSPDYFSALHSLVFAPGSHYPQGTYNYLGAKISLAHTSLNIPTWRELLVDYPKKEIVDFLEFGFPISFHSRSFSHNL